MDVLKAFASALWPLWLAFGALVVYAWMAPDE